MFVAQFGISFHEILSFYVGQLRQSQSSTSPSWVRLLHYCYQQKSLQAKSILISAGIKMNTLLEDLKTVVEGARIIRVHNNTPAMVGAGCSVFSTGEGEIDYFGNRNT